MQVIRNNIPQKYDYGRRGNIAKYGQHNPPIYDLSNITTPVALYCSDHDSVVGPQVFIFIDILYKI